MSVFRSKWVSRVESETRIVYFEHVDSGALRWTLPASLCTHRKPQPKPKPKPKAAPTSKPKFKPKVPTRNDRGQPAPVPCAFASPHMLETLSDHHRLFLL